MQQQNHNCSFTANVTANQAVNAINNVSGWWVKNVTGSSQNLNDVFTVHFGEPYVTFKINELDPGKKIGWLVTDCYLPWLKNKTEWNDTRVVFEISEKNNSTTINLTHIGLVPEVECYESCVKGWDQYFKGSLQKLLTEGEGQPS